MSDAHGHVDANIDHAIVVRDTASAVAFIEHPFNLSQQR
jgi:hypothetical protein